jgi:uncharacterized protein (DUF302 family)
MTAIPGLITRPSPYPVRETVDRLETLLRAKGAKVFARIDQAAEAQSAALTMPPMELLLFGNPKGGTPIMQAVPEAGIELPLKALSWQAPDGKVYISFNDAAYVQSRFNLPAELLRPLAAVAGLIDSIVSP